MAWFRPMGAAEVAYHQETVVGRADDHPGAALDYYGSRGETPLRWGGAGAAHLGLEGEVTAEAYEAAFGPGGFAVPGTDRSPTPPSRGLPGRPGTTPAGGPRPPIGSLGGTVPAPRGWRCSTPSP